MTLQDMGDLEKNIGSRAEADDSSSDTSTLLNKPETEVAASDPATDSIALPAEEASAPEVRRYITEVLTINHELDVHDAQNIASKWTIGSGRDLRKFTPCIYRDIFGSATAWILYREVKVVAAQENFKKSPPMKWPARLGIAGTLVAFEALFSFVLTHFGGMVLLWVMAPFYFFGLCGCVAVLADGADKLGDDKKAREKTLEKVENELIKYWGIDGNGTKSSG
ncbi:hypothetical protein CLAFUW4_00200 [Fulvia fulva]|uniref:Uncharacterized protein n=1 Tax=Passalora fulva TaxID=5499 RepID=A0A9Q8L751_PASFU|nr:uncharacterized protein CLAFUR5_00199 [Fulvia fulva]KAK4635957.1 hypothetical protein CLAFUR4_00200 [Fulvia fulva]KAK4636943.1 hypothetical protein CLAFUR0_00200 [Fulvia fulva]UJO11964.1 hypothetical protein CLAFUR5_00199 [Fulvia fulva]WPV08396.1 hypothetical protein CLAFUW4_00200 [Fulvia fulva]WPV24846.1 hypothetical protein CLAFUW7_00202 [Fulvia fulva]